MRRIMCELGYSLRPETTKVKSIFAKLKLHAYYFPFCKTLHFVLRYIYHWHETALIRACWACFKVFSPVKTNPHFSRESDESLLVGLVRQTYGMIPDGVQRPGLSGFARIFAANFFFISWSVTLFCS